MPSKHPSIQCAKNGPYLVKNLPQFTNSYDEDIPTKATIALCRCGASKNKPFRDGTQWYIDFKADESKAHGVAAEGVETELKWYRVGDINAVPTGRVATVMAGTHSVALANVDGKLGALCNHCPH